MTGFWLGVFITASQGWGFSPGAGLEMGHITPYSRISLAASSQQKSVNDGYTYSLSAELSPSWRLAPSVGFISYGYTGTWAKHETAPFGAITYRFSKPGGYLRAYLASGLVGVESNTLLTSKLFLTLSIDWQTAVNATGYTAGLRWTP